MADKPEIVKKLMEDEKLGKLSGKIQNNYEEIQEPEELLEDTLDDTKNVVIETMEEEIHAPCKEKMEEKSYEIKQVSEREIWVGETRLYLDENKVVYVKQLSIPDEKRALLEIDAYYKIANLVEGKVGMLIDINDSGQPSPVARKIYQRAVEHEKFGKIAFIGMHPVARVIAAFVIGVTKKKDIQFFKSKDEALVWLKE